MECRSSSRSPGTSGPTTPGQVVRSEELYDLLFDAGERGPLNREIQEVKLFEAGPVSTPAYSQTSVGVRSADQMTDEDRRAFIEECVRTSSANERTEELPDESVVPAVETDEERAEPEGAAPMGTPEGHEKEAVQRAEKPVTPSTRKASVPMDVMTIEERRVRRDEIRSRLADIDREYSGAELPSDIRSEWEKLDREFEEHGRAIKSAEARLARLQQLADDEGIELVILGGMGNFAGAIAGAFAFEFLLDEFKGLPAIGSFNTGKHWQLWMGLFIVAVVILAPRGLLGLAERLMRRKEQSDV